MQNTGSEWHETCGHNFHFSLNYSFKNPWTARSSMLQYLKKKQKHKTKQKNKTWSTLLKGKQQMFRASVCFFYPISGHPEPESQQFSSLWDKGKEQMHHKINDLHLSVLSFCKIYCMNINVIIVILMLFALQRRCSGDVQLMGMVLFFLLIFKVAVITIIIIFDFNIFVKMDSINLSFTTFYDLSGDPVVARTCF